MIGVAVDASQRDTVAEFFELFKTPWEFCRPGEWYEVMICASDHPGYRNARLALVFSGQETSFDSEHQLRVNARKGGLVVSEEGKEIPVYGTLATFSEAANLSLLKDQATSQPVAIILERENKTILRVGYDLFEEVRFLLTNGQSAENARIPALEEHIELLRNWICLAGLSLAEIPAVPAGHAFAACLTHDIDHPILRNHRGDHTMLGFLYRACLATPRDVLRGRKPLENWWRNWLAVLRLPLVYLGLARDPWKDFDRYLELEAGLGSTFFVIPRSAYAGRTSSGSCPRIRACRYELDQIIVQLRRIVAAGSEVGVHGLDAWIDPEAGGLERERVSSHLPQPELGVRMHWLLFDPNSPELLERAGFSYDTTVGYRETVGYRAGTTQAYKPLGLERLLELPLHVMDTALFYPSYLHLSDREAGQVVERLLDDAARLGGTLTFNWHDRSIAPERLWGRFYVDLIDELKRRKAWLPTAGQAVRWYRKRRSSAIRVTGLDGNNLRVSACLETSDTLPGLKIRIHKPRAQSLANSKSFRTKAAFVEAEFNRSTEVSLTI